MHPVRAIREAVTATLQAASIRVDVGGVSTPVVILDHPPLGIALPDESLPGVYVFIRDEQLTPGHLRGHDDRVYLVDVVLQAKGDRIDAVDQVDDMHLAVEIALAANPTLSALVDRFEPIGSTLQVDRAEMTFAARRLTYRAVRSVLRRDPTVA